MAQEVNNNVMEAEEKVTPTVVEIPEEKPAKKQRGRARGGRTKIQKTDIKTDAEIAKTVINETSEIIPVIDKKTVNKTKKTESAPEDSAEAAPAVQEEAPVKRSKRPNRNSQKRTRRTTKKNVEE